MPHIATKLLKAPVLSYQIEARLFYPTSTEPTPTRYGRWTLSLADGAPIIEGRYPLIALSHGMGGIHWHQYDLARALVEAGFVVIAPYHARDRLRYGQDELMTLRPMELKAAIDASFADPDLSPHLIPDWVGGFGHSMGGMTVMRLAGGQVEVDRILDHCQRNFASDPIYCSIGRDAFGWLDFREWFRLTPDVDPEADMRDPRLKAVAAATPVGVMFDDLSEVEAEVMLIRAGQDRVLQYPYHAENIRELLPEAPDYLELEDAGHYAFLTTDPEEAEDNSPDDPQDGPEDEPEDEARSLYIDEVIPQIVQHFMEARPDRR